MYNLVIINLYYIDKIGVLSITLVISTGSFFNGLKPPPKATVLAWPGGSGSFSSRSSSGVDEPTSHDFWKRTPIPNSEESYPHGSQNKFFWYGDGIWRISSPGAPQQLRATAHWKCDLATIQSSMVWLKGPFTGNPSFSPKKIQGFPAMLPARRWPC